QGKLKFALASYQEGVRIRQQALGPDHPRTANLMGSLGMLQARLGNVAIGQRLVQHAFETNLRVYGPNHENTLEHRKNLVLTLVMAKRYDEAIPHLREIVRSDVPPGLQIDLKDPSLADMRGLQSFSELEAEVARRSAGAKIMRPDAVITSEI